MSQNDRIRKIKRIFNGRPTIEGAGVHLKRAFGFSEVPLFDPFLLLDDFRSDNPAYYESGFPWHPHRGIETITYMIDGRVEHGDSIGNSGIIGPGDVQWMTAGNGILHQEMPKGDNTGKMGGFQLWVNLPASHKMMDPRYRDVKSDTIPLVKLDSGVSIKIICGNINGVRGPVRDVVVDVEYLDLSIPIDSEYMHSVRPGYTTFVYLIEGMAMLGDERPEVANGNLVLFDDGNRISLITNDKPARMLLLAGKPIGEPIAWRGPIVMNTKEELQTAYTEYRQGTFIKQGNIAQ